MAGIATLNHALQSIDLNKGELRLAFLFVWLKVDDMLVYKIFRTEEQTEFEADRVTHGAPIDLADGYVHLSAADQVKETCAKYFAGVEGLFLLAVETDRLGDDLKWEPSRGGADFPHLYRELRASDVVWTKPLPLGPEGHEFPEEL